MGNTAGNDTRWADEPARAVQLLTVPEAAARLRVSLGKAWQMVADGRLRSLKIDSSRRVPDDAIEDYVKGRVAAEEQARRAESAVA